MDSTVLHCGRTGQWWRCDDSPARVGHYLADREDEDDATDGAADTTQRFVGEGRLERGDQGVHRLRPLQTALSPAAQHAEDHVDGDDGPQRGDETRGRG